MNRVARLLDEDQCERCREAPAKCHSFREIVRPKSDLTREGLCTLRQRLSPETPTRCAQAAQQAIWRAKALRPQSVPVCLPAEPCSSKTESFPSGAALDSPASRSRASPARLRLETLRSSSLPFWA